MKKRWIYLFVSGAALLFVVGIWLGTKIEIEQVNIQNSYSSGISGTIAVVNQDVGVISSGETLNYSEAFISSLSGDYKTVSYKEAQEGLGKGDFSAVLVFPSNLSASVYSLNESTLQSPQVQFTVNKFLPEGEYIGTYIKLLDLESNINKTISYLYVTSLYDEFHDAQDQVKKVLKNGEDDLSALDNLKLHDFRLDVDWSDLPEVDITFNEIDFEEFISDVRGYADDISKKYTDSYAAAQKDYDEIDSDMLSIINNILPQEENWYGNICGVVADYQEQLNQQQMYNTQIKKQLDAYVSEVEEWKYEVETYDQAYKHSADKFKDDTEECYESMFDLAKIIINDFYSLLLQYESTLADTDTDCMETPDYPMISIDFMYKKDSDGISLRDQIGADVDKIKDFFDSDLDFNESLDLNSSDSSDKNAVAVSGESNFRQNIPSFDFTYTPPNIPIYSNDLGDIPNNQNINIPVDLNQTFLDSCVLLTEESQKYNPLDYLNDTTKGQIDSIIDLYRSNLYVVDGRLSNNVISNNNLFMNGFNVLNSYVSTLKSDASTAYSNQEKDLEDALFAFYTVKETSNEENKSLLESFSEKLPNSRKNSVTNKELVNFTISPIEFAEGEIRNSEKTDFISDRDLLQIYQTIIFIAVVLVILSIVVISMIYLRDRRREKHNNAM